MEKETVTITVEEYTQLLDAQNKLSALENGGVDNWEWYSESLADYYAEKEKDEQVPFAPR